MPVQGSNASHFDLLDHVLDKGIVIEAWVCLSVVGIDLITIDARVIVASIETYLKHADSVAQVTPLFGPSIGPREPVGPRRGH